MAAAGAIPSARPTRRSSAPAPDLQPSLRRHPQPLRPEPTGRQQRRRGRGPGRRHDRAGRRQRHGRLAAQPGQLLQRGRLRPRRAGCRHGRSPTWPGRWASSGRWGAPWPTSLSSDCCPGPTRGRRSLSTPAAAAGHARPGGRAGRAGLAGLRVAWSPDLGLPVSRRSSPRWRRPGRSSPTWAARSSTPRRTCPAPMRCSGPCGRTSSRWPTDRCCGAPRPGRAERDLERRAGA